MSAGLSMARNVVVSLAHASGCDSINKPVSVPAFARGLTASGSIIEISATVQSTKVLADSAVSKNGGGRVTLTGTSTTEACPRESRS